MPVKPNDMAYEQARRLFDYDPLTGHLTWTSEAPHPCLVGRKAGSVWKSGYVMVRYGGKLYRAHRIIWVWMMGVSAAADVEHRDLCRSNNIWENLRAATRSQNLQNMGLSRRNTSGYKNIAWNKRRGAWRVRFNVDGRTVTVGHFASRPEAIAARDAAMLQHQPEFGRAA